MRGPPDARRRRQDVDRLRQRALVAQRDDDLLRAGLGGRADRRRAAGRAGRSERVPADRLHAPGRRCRGPGPEGLACVDVVGLSAAEDGVHREGWRGRGDGDRGGEESRAHGSGTIPHAGRSRSTGDDLHVAAQRDAREQPAQVVLGGPQAAVAHGLADARRAVGAVDRDAVPARPALRDVLLGRGERDRAAAVGPPPVSRSVSVTPKRPVGVGEPGPPTPTREPPDDLALVADGDAPRATGRRQRPRLEEQLGGVARDPGDLARLLLGQHAQPAGALLDDREHARGAPARSSWRAVATIFPSGSSRRPTLRSSFGAAAGPAAAAPGSRPASSWSSRRSSSGVVLAAVGGVTSAPCSESGLRSPPQPASSAAAEQRGEHREPSWAHVRPEAVEQLVGQRHVVRAEIGPVVEDRDRRARPTRRRRSTGGSSWRTACRRSAPCSEA